MSFPEAERNDAPRLPRDSEDTTNNAAANHFLLAFENNAPHLKNLLAMQNGVEQTRSSFKGEHGSPLPIVTDLVRSPINQVNDNFQTDFRSARTRHRSPWALPSEQQGLPSLILDVKKVEKTNPPAEANDIREKTSSDEKIHPSSKAKEVQENTDKTSSEESETGAPAARRLLTKVDHKKEQSGSQSELQNWLPSLTLDGSKVKEKATETVNEIHNRWDLIVDKGTDALASAAEALASDTKTGVDNKTKEPKAQETVQPVSIESPSGTWKKTGSQWELFDKQGQKIEQKDGKVTDVCRESDGGIVLKLEDGKSIKHKTDGSKLEFDSENRINKITYKDGSTRSFEWQGDQLTQMTSKTGEWTRLTDSQGKLKNEWAQNGKTSGWSGEMILDNKTGDLTIGPTKYATDLSVEKRNDDGSREITYQNKDVVKISKNGLISQINYADGTERKFTWSKNADAKGEDDKHKLATVQVKRGNDYYLHTSQDDGSWQVQTWSWQNNRWGKAEAETNTFNLNNKTGEYSYIDSSDGIRHIFQPGGIQKDVSRDGASLEYENGALVRARKGDAVREFEWKNNKLVAIHDGVQGKNWTPGKDGAWESDKGDKQSGDAFISASGEIGFKNGDKANIIKMDGAEYHRIQNDSEKSQVDIKMGEVHVTAGDGSLRQMKTNADGAEVTHESVTRNGKTESWTRGERLSNGNYVWTNDQDPGKQEERASVTQQDGRLSIQYPDGRKYESSTTGGERLANDKEGWYINYKNGQPSESQFPDGTIRRFKFDGPGTSPKSIEVRSPEGTVTTMNRVADGVYDYKSGNNDPYKWNAKFTVTRDGTYKYVDSDEKGKTVTRHINGLTIAENPNDKSRIEKFNNEITKVTRENKTVELVRNNDEKKSISEVRDYAGNTAYKKNENGEFVPSAIDPAKPFNKLDELARKGQAIVEESGTVNFVDSDGRQIRQRPGERGELVSSKESTIDAVLKNTSMSAEQKDRISRNILEYSQRNNISGMDKSVFQESLAKFANRTDISDKEKADTYEHFNRLLESKSDKVFAAKERALLAEQLAWHIGNIDRNAQGENPNCQVTTIRGRMLYESPSSFARMMTDVITTGQFVTKDKSIIKMPHSSLTYGKGSEEARFPPEDGTRTWLGKISDVTCSNIHWQRQTRCPSGEIVRAGHLVYRQDPPGSRKDTGCRVYKEPGDGYIYPQNDQAGKLISTPGLYARDIADTYRQIVGNGDTVVLAANRRDIISGAGVAVLDEAQLHKFLSENKGVHIAQIWTGTDWVWKEPARKYGIKPKDENDGEHVVLVKDYDPATRTVAVDNSWSNKYDRMGKERRITLNELYLAMSKQ